MHLKTMITGSLVLFLVLQGCATMNSAPRFTNLGNGICQDTVTGQMWQIKKSARVNSLAEARQYVSSLTLGGYTDWRLPTIYELYDLNYRFDLHQNGNCVLDREGNYWAGKKDGDGLVGAWEIGDQCDPERQYAPGSKGSVRAVRP